MSLPDLALAASARDWSDRLHRFVLDHGGAKVHGRVMSAEQALAGDYDILLIDDVCSFLTPRLVVELRSSGKAVVGVFDHGDGPDAKRLLLEAGVGDVIESDAAPEEFIELCVSTLVHVAPTSEEPPPGAGVGYRIGITGPPGGVGVTELACGLGMALSAQVPTVLVDANQAWPSVGQRLGLPVLPNLMTAVDLAVHSPSRIEASLHRLGDLDIVCGLASPAAGAVAPSELRSVVSELASRRRSVIVDLGPVGSSLDSFPLRELDAILIVGTGTPTGVTRLVRAFEELAKRVEPRCEVAVVLNRLDRSSRRRAEAIALLSRAIGPVPVVSVKEDPRLKRWSWDGVPASGGDFERSARRLAALFSRAVAS